MPKYDVFLSHNSTDKPAVEELAQRLSDKEGLLPFLDRWHLIPGEPWQEALEEALDHSRTCAVFIGPGGVSPWEHEEMRAAIKRRVADRDFRVIPVLLPGAERGERGRLPDFLTRTTWVEFRENLSDDDAFHRLVAGIRGIPPGRRPGEAVYEGICPYRGLEVFEKEHAHFFFGREAATEWLVNELRGNRFLGVVGPSGSGKSSLVRAGLVPALGHGDLPGSAKWPVCVFKPGPRPLESLAVNLTKLVGPPDDPTAPLRLIDALETDERQLHLTTRLTFTEIPANPAAALVAVVDQFEEIFTLCHDEKQRQAFIENLLYASAIEGGQAIVILTMRADFYSKCAAYPALAARLTDHQMLVSPMVEEELRQAIERPAQIVGLEFAPGLVDTLLHDVQTEPGALPLLQHTLLELWERREGRRLTFAAYRKIGGIQGAIAHRAESIYSDFDKVQQAITQRVMLRLTQPGERTEDTRRRATLAELLPAKGEGPDVTSVVRALADARLLTTSKAEPDGELVDVAHEALIRGWPRLRKWIDDNREALRIQRRLTEAAEEWQRNNRDESWLYRRARLAEAQEWARSHATDLSDLESEFVAASTEAQEARQKAARRRVQFVIAGLVVAVVISALAFIAFQQRAIAVREADEDQSLALAASAQRALCDNNADLAIALALEANKIDFPSEQTQRALAAVTYYSPGTIRRFVGHSEAVSSVAFSPDGRTAISGSADDSLILWNINPEQATPIIRRFVGHTDDINSVAFSPDGRKILSGSSDDSLILWNVESGEAIHRFLGHTGDVNSVAFGPDGHTILSGSQDGNIILWDIASGGEVFRINHEDEVLSVAFSPDGSTIFSGTKDDSLCAWDAKTGENIRCIKPATTYGVTSLAVNPNNQTVLAGAGGYGPGIFLWDVDNGNLLATLAGHIGGNTMVAFDAGGQFAISGSYDHNLILWNMSTKTEVRHYLGHADDITSVAFSPDGRTVLSGSADSTLRLWDIFGGAEITRLAGYTGMAVSSDGRVIVSGTDYGNHLVLLDSETGEVIRNFDEYPSGPRMLTSLAFSPDGRFVFSGSWDGIIYKWDIQQGSAIPIFDGHPGGVTSIAISQDGRYALSGSYGPPKWPGFEELDDILILWNVETGEISRRFIGHNRIVRSVAISSDGQMALSGADDGTVRLWNIDSGREIRRFEGHTGKVFSVIFGPDERTVLSGSDDFTIRQWDIETGEEIRRFEGHTAVVNCLALRPDGQIVLSGSDDFTVRLWDIETGLEINRLIGHTGSVRDVAFSPDGQTILSRSGDSTIRLWRGLPPDDLIKWTYENRYVRELNCAERQQYGAEPFCDENGTLPSFTSYPISPQNAVIDRASRSTNE